MWNEIKSGAKKQPLTKNFATIILLEKAVTCILPVFLHSFTALKCFLLLLPVHNQSCRLVLLSENGRCVVAMVTEHFCIVHITSISVAALTCYTISSKRWLSTSSCVCHWCVHVGGVCGCLQFSVVLSMVISCSLLPLWARLDWNCVVGFVAQLMHRNTAPVVQSALERF